MTLRDFYKGKRVFVSGHTGFKGSWLVSVLSSFGADVCGYALKQKKGELFDCINGSKLCQSNYGDVSDIKKLKKVFNNFKPEIVLHLAAQPLVLKSYSEPRETYLTNVMGTVNILECVRNSTTVKSFINVTTDKVYKNIETDKGYVETDELDGFDPYSNSKSCSELATHCYKQSFLDGFISASTARAGNVIGGGDFSKDRIIPDCVKFCSNKTPIEIRNPYSIRPYQFVLEPLFLYLEIAKRQYLDPSFAGYYNIGPDEKDCVDTKTLVEYFCSAWQDGASYIVKTNQNAPHEAKFLKLDNTKIKTTLGWKPVYNTEQAVLRKVEWSKAYLNGEKMLDVTLKQIADFETLYSI